MKKAILLSILPLVASAFFMQSCTSLFNSNPYEKLVTEYSLDWRHVEGSMDQDVLIAPDGRVLFESKQWMNNADSTVLFRTFQDRYLLVIPGSRYILGASFGLAREYIQPEYPRSVIYIIDVADDRVLYRVDLEYAVLVDISKGYAWGRDPDTGELRSSSLEVVSR